MKCANCQAEIPEASQFCLKCGNPQGAKSAEALKQAFATGQTVPTQPDPQKPSLTPTHKVGIGCLGLLFLLFVISQISQDGEKPSQRNSGSVVAPSAPAEPLLRLESFSWSISYNYATAEGEVTNVSSEPLKNVQAMGKFYTKDETFITSADAMIDYNPILPGQTSPFKVMATHNPAMDTCRISFKELFGGSIEHSVKPKPEPKPKAKKK
jgi:hypothetical protein